MINPKQKGFTLIEMVVVLGIFAVMTSIVVFNYGKFTSETILTNMAYEVALSLREAQIYGTSVRNPNGTILTADFRHSYGIHFMEDSSNYYLFSDTVVDDQEYNGDGTDCASPGSGECVSVYGLQRGIKITDVRTKVNNNSNVCTNPPGGELDIIFKRPDPEAIFGSNGKHSYAQITLKAPGPEGSERFVVVSSNGQMRVTNESICN